MRLAPPFQRIAPLECVFLIRARACCEMFFFSRLFSKKKRRAVRQRHPAPEKDVVGARK
jgi:hypothetical protein